jgi:hypothetical protein
MPHSPDPRALAACLVLTFAAAPRAGSQQLVQSPTPPAAQVFARRSLHLATAPAEPRELGPCAPDGSARAARPAGAGAP